jgi:hypothetical protein
MSDKIFALIKKGKHYSGFSLPSISFGEKTISKVLSFSESCRYDLKSEDQLDVNKLFGIGYLPSHHQFSCRFGWRYDLTNEKMEILAYWYDSGKRYFEHLCWLEIGQRRAVFTIKATKEKHYLSVETDGNAFTKTLDFGIKMIGYELKPFFGGNQAAPHDMIIYISGEITY